MLNSIIPTPKTVSASGGSFPIDGFTVINGSSSPNAKNELTAHSGSYPVVFTLNKVCSGKPESYILDITEEKTTITAADEAGLYYGAKTLLQCVDDGRLPEAHIEDCPDVSDRGLMLENRYGSDFMTLDDYKAAIDYLSDMKYNQLTIGVYGCWCVQYDMRLSEFLYIPLKNHPELRTPRDIRYYSPKKGGFVEEEDRLPVIFETDYFGDLIKYAKTKNIKIKPLFNSFGHNTLIPRLHPELSAKDENGNPTKHGFCVSDDAVYDFMFSIYDEIIDRYLAPNGLDAIEIGLDEVYAWLGEDPDDVYAINEPYCRCEKCRSLERKDLMLRYIVRVVKYLKSRGMKSVYIYHDMLFEIFDIVNEELVELFKKEDIYDVVVLDWWNYSKEEDLFAKREVNNLFRSISKPFNGYYHWVVPMEYNNNIFAHAKLVKKHGFEGIEAYSSFEYCFDRPFAYQAQLGWNLPGEEDFSKEYPDFLALYAANRFPGNEAAKKALNYAAKLTCNDLTPNLMNTLEYYWYTYTAKDEPYPREFHAAVFRKILAEREKYTEYFEDIVRNAPEAIAVFDASESRYGRIWAAICDHYRTYALFYLGMLDCYDGHAGDKEYLLAKFNELLAWHEVFMARIEDTRIEANIYVYMRNHSITRQLLADLIDYYEKNDTPFDITNFDYCISDRYKRLR
ncbi:MAG: family 20 glycosylhydrolase [Clostridia bacterium]|nr:family 20 glycosylhydrolase [Clostridia bacterium]